ncbi:MAG: ATP-binding protein [Actinomycetota bacterium]|nr:ATP-binding protein [Actinomycetota bacterium]
MNARRGWFPHRSGNAKEPRPTSLVGTATDHGHVYQAGRDLYVAEGQQPYRLEPFPTEQSPLPPEQARRQPSRLLAARRRVVEFTGRVEQLNGLASWRDGPERAAVLLVNGPAGQGKTRLAEHFAQLSVDAGWQVCTAYPHNRSDSHRPTPEATVDGAAKLLVLVDYAERWPLNNLLGMLEDVAGQDRSHARFLMLARPAGLCGLACTTGWKKVLA